MTTLISICMYLASCLLAAITGALAEQFKNGMKNETSGEVAVGSFLFCFILAASLQIFA